MDTSPHGSCEKGKYQGDSDIKGAGIGVRGLHSERTDGFSGDVSGDVDHSFTGLWQEASCGIKIIEKVVREDSKKIKEAL